METYKLLVGSQWRETKDTRKVKNPFDDSIVGNMCIGSKEDVSDAIDAAQKAYNMTKNQSRSDRATLLKKISDKIEKEALDLAETISLEAGKPIKQARREVERAVMTFTIASEEAKRLGGEIIPVDIGKGSQGYYAQALRFPLGPIAAISPFNFPLNLVAHKVAPAIAAGNTVVHKPAGNTPITAVKLAKIIEGCGAIPGTYNVVQCNRNQAELLATDDRIKLLTFTGSAQVGWHLKSIAKKKKVTLELGGNAGVVVDKDSDLKWAAKRCAEGSFAYAGQICISIQRIFVEKSVFDDFRDLLISETEKLKAGDPLCEDTFLGPIIDTGNADRVMEWISEAIKKGAKLLYGGKREGNVITPAILSEVNDECLIVREEVFGPVTVLESCLSFSEGVKRVNDSKFGLQAAVFTYDLRKIENAFRTIDVGGLIVNDFPTFRVDNYPYGGIKESGTGREGVKYAMEEMSELKTLVLNLNR